MSMYNMYEESLHHFQAETSPAFLYRNMKWKEKNSPIRRFVHPSGKALN